MWYEAAVARGSCSVVRCWLRSAGCCCAAARAATFYVTVAGLGGEPDYEQRFTANAMDLDKIFKSATGAHVYTLTGKQSTKAKLTEVMGEVARDAKPEDDFVLTLIGHGSFDGVEYKFNLVGPDMSASGAGGAVRQGAGEAPVDCGYNQRERWGGAGAGAAGPRGDRGDEERARRRTRRCLRATGWRRCRTRRRTRTRATRSLRWRRLRMRTARRRSSTRRRSGWRRSIRSLRTPARAMRCGRLRGGMGREGALMATFTVVRIGAAQAAMNDPAKRDLMAKKEDLEQKIDALKYEKAAMEPGEYKKELTAALVELAKVQEELDK